VEAEAIRDNEMYYILRWTLYPTATPRFYFESLDPRPSKGGWFSTGWLATKNIGIKGPISQPILHLPI
jgi:hypothetical protein